MFRDRPEIIDKFIFKIEGGHFSYAKEGEAKVRVGWGLFSNLPRLAELALDHVGIKSQVLGALTQCCFYGTTLLVKNLP